MQGGEHSPPFSFSRPKYAAEKMNNKKAFIKDGKIFIDNAAFDALQHAADKWNEKAENALADFVTECKRNNIDLDGNEYTLDPDEVEIALDGADTFANAPAIGVYIHSYYWLDGYAKEQMSIDAFIQQTLGVDLYAADRKQTMTCGYFGNYETRGCFLYNAKDA